MYTEPNRFKHFLTLLKTALNIEAQHSEAIYRILQLPTATDPHIHFQIIGKGIILKMTPERIMRDDMLMGFSKADIALITHYGTKAEHKAEPQKAHSLWRIVQQLFTDKKSAFLVHDPENNAMAEKSAQDLYFDPKTKEAFNAADALVIGYSAAEERYRQIAAETNPAPCYRLLSFADHEVEYQSLDTNTISKKSSELLFNEKELLAQFSAAEQGLIGYDAAESRYQRIMRETMSKPTLHLCHTMMNADNTWQYQSIITGETTVIAVDDLFYNTDLLRQFSAEDRSIVAFSAGELSRARFEKLKISSPSDDASSVQ